jgi:phage gp36-like protein
MTRYATTADLARLGISSAALQGVATATQEAALDACSAVADGYLRARGYVLPLTTWSNDLTRAVAVLAAFDLLVTRGYDPSAGTDDVLLKRVEMATSWLRDVAASRITPALTDSTTSVEEESQQTSYTTRPRRRWLR